ncbi:MAG: hypothetical protein WKF84_29815 [Pyrinomonadaceae bacterium]
MFGRVGILTAGLATCASCKNARGAAAALTGAIKVIALNDLPEEVRGGASSGITPVFLRDLESVVSQSLPAQPIPDEKA